MTAKGKKMSWFSAFLLMWRWKAVGLGRNHKMKSLWVTSAVIFIVVGPLVGYNDSQNYSGVLPPEAPLVKGTGAVVRYMGHVSLKEAPYVLLKMDDGMIYRTEHRIAPVVFEKLGELSPPVKIYVEGFLLQNGRGSFYPLRLTDLSGNDLVSADSLMKELLMSREAFNFPFLKFVFFVELVLWGGAAFYARQVRNLELQKLQGS